MNFPRYFLLNLKIFLNKIDNFLLAVIFYIKSNYKFNLIFKPFLFYFFLIFENLNIFLLNNTPNFSKFLIDFQKVLSDNSNFLLRVLRIYFIIYFLIYWVTWVIIFVAILIDNNYL